MGPPGARGFLLQQKIREKPSEGQLSGSPALGHRRRSSLHPHSSSPPFQRHSSMITFLLSQRADAIRYAADPRRCSRRGAYCGSHGHSPRLAKSSSASVADAPLGVFHVPPSSRASPEARFAGRRSDTGGDAGSLAIRRITVGRFQSDVHLELHLSSRAYVRVPTAPPDQAVRALAGWSPGFRTGWPPSHIDSWGPG